MSRNLARSYFSCRAVREHSLALIARRREPSPSPLIVPDDCRAPSHGDFRACGYRLISDLVHICRRRESAISAKLAPHPWV